MRKSKKEEHIEEGRRKSIKQNKGEIDAKDTIKNRGDERTGKYSKILINEQHND